MISNLDSKLERIMKVLNISSSSKRRLDEPTTVFAQSKKKKTHEKCEPWTTVSNQGVTLGQEAIVEPFISPLTHLDNPVKEVTSVNRDLNEGMSREEEVFDPLNNATHHHEPPSTKRQRFGERIIFYAWSKKKNSEPQKTSIVECGDKEAAHASLVGAVDVATMFVNDKPLPQEITPSLVVHKATRDTCFGSTWLYQSLQCVSIKKVLPTVTKEISRLNDLFKAYVFGSYYKSWFTNLLNPRH
ncbi:uncharacterized protein LOC142537349 isoform X2 [Primulina tabacum]|uniref:uncharacterized protein LOC142537349 isoform X2 n=1 Tax=Primulina tabacum TaxID=48773 RepID=UPI003F5ADA64